MLYHVFIAVCLIGMMPKDCDIHNAVDWIAAPEPQNGLAACMIHGQEYVSKRGGAKAADVKKRNKQAAQDRPAAPKRPVAASSAKG